MKIAVMSGARWTAGKGSWADPYAPAPDAESLEMIEAAALAGWYGITTILDEHGLRCVAAADREIAVVTVRGLTMTEARCVAAGVRLLDDWSIPKLAEIVRQACGTASDELAALHLKADQDMTTFSPYIVDASTAIDRLAGRAGFNNVYRRRLTELEIGHLVTRVEQAKAAAGLTAKAFRGLNGDSLRSFARAHRLTAVEVRFAQALAQLTWAMRHVHQVSSRVARQRSALASSAEGVQ